MDKWDTKELADNERDSIPPLSWSESLFRKDIVEPQETSAGMIIDEVLDEFASIIVCSEP